MQTLLILGRQPAIGLVELESLYGANNIRLAGSSAAIVESGVDFARLGGSIKAGRVLDVLGSTKWYDIQKHIEHHLSGWLEIPEKNKLRLGISAYGFDITPKKLLATGLNLKKTLRNNGQSVRLVPNNGNSLSSAQVIHNGLIGKLGCELLVIKDGARTIIAQTTHEQDIESYTLRDRGRPKRDARVGMLPPKLAQIIVNLAVGKAQSFEPRVLSQEKTPAKAMSSRSTTWTQDTKSEVQPESHTPIANSHLPPSNSHIPVVLDPFCGTGVVLQEALLIGYGVLGSDLDRRMVEYTTANMEWLKQNIKHEGNFWGAKTGDATSWQWTEKFDTIASETYLGRAFTTPPGPETLEKNRQDCNTIIGKFLQNVARQTKPGFRLCLALPVWLPPSSNSQIPIAKFLHLPLLDSLTELGYNRIKFVHALESDLIYHREGQIVGRELVVLVRR